MTLFLLIIFYSFYLGTTSAKSDKITISRHRGSYPQPVNTCTSRPKPHRTVPTPVIKYFNDDASFSYDSFSYDIQRSYPTLTPTTFTPTKSPTTKTTSPTESPVPKTLSPTKINSSTSVDPTLAPAEFTSSKTITTVATTRVTSSKNPASKPLSPSTKSATSLNPTLTPTFIPTISYAPFSAIRNLPPNDSNYTFCSSILPACFTWQLNFSLSCQPENIKYGTGTGIKRYSCRISSTDATVTDMTPVLVRDIQIVELDASLKPVSAEKMTDLNLIDGDMVHYTSIVATNPNVTLGGVSMKIIGTNSAGKEVDLVWTVQYRNSTSNAIVFYPGNSIGWTNFVSNFTLLNVS